MKEEVCSECQNTNGEHKRGCKYFPGRHEHTITTPAAMTEKQALAEAQRRWGPCAYVFDRDLNDYQRANIRMFGRFYVGNPALGRGFPYGNGNTWEEAFANVHPDATTE
jgi:hypothetical protein